MNPSHRIGLISSLLSLALLPGCGPKTAAIDPAPAGPDYSRQLAPGSSALRLVLDPARVPVAQAWRNGDAFLYDALDESLIWFAAPSSRQFYPIEGITHEQARASLVAFQELLDNSLSEEDFITEFHQLFDIYESVGYDGRGTVLFTGYYAGEFPASLEETGRFRYPLYQRPADLATDPTTGHPLGRRTADGSVVPYYTRREIESSNMFAGSELVWLEDPLSVYIIHINGSAKLRLPDGSLMFVGYGGKTDRPYGSLGKAIIDAGLLTRDKMSLAGIKKLYQRQPERIAELIYTNENYVFFTEYEGDKWPSGSLGVKVTQETSLATDKQIYPRGGLVLADTQAVTFSSGTRRFTRFMFDQDTGGAIEAPGRADIYMGDGNSAEILAGGQYAEGKLFYFFLKPRHVAQYSPDPAPGAGTAPHPVLSNVLPDRH